MNFTAIEELRQRLTALEDENRRLRERIEAHREREKKYRFLAENVTDVLFLQDMDLDVTYVSPSVTSLFGYSLEEVQALKLEDIMTPDSLSRALASFEEAASQARKGLNPEIPLMRYEYIRKDGSTFWGELKVSFVYDHEGRPIGTQGILRNIDERIRMEEALKESEFKFRSLFELSPQAICLTEHRTGVFIDVNSRFCELSGYKKEEVLGSTVFDLGFLSEDERDVRFGQLFTSGEIQGMEIEFGTKSGNRITVLVFSKVIRIASQVCVLSVLWDVSESRRLQAQLVQAQRLKALGNLAGGIAHDFNNLLMAIMGNLSLVLLTMNSDHPHYPMLKDIEKQVQSGARLTRQLLGYARQGKYEVRPVNFNDLVAETARTFGRTRKDIIIHQRLCPDLNFLEADQGQMEQVLWNLFINAGDAMPGGGELFLETSNVTHRDMQGSPYDPKPGSYVRFRITDTGTGMDNETLEHLFEPFFTTKEKGRGSGLGLASVYGIVKGHGGYIDVESEQGKGSTFCLFFPASRKSIVRPVQHIGPVEGRGNILLVDDEERVLYSTSKLIEHLGYRVLTARSGFEAVEVYRDGFDEIDLVILDVVMPEMNGAMTFEKLKEINPSVKVLLSSGFSIEGLASSILEQGGDGFIQKPFRLEELSRKMKEIMEKG
ncbi:MAG: PAS domain S-box protein [Deltaproteobacteria bacterium]|nr:PAS domain S-box protein [Deltaproteobacteria bacterium]MBW2015644.1 PAS domain S-box protein [Deltaproteobacteria bacterium]MBW2128351.1 PAS domain S-box protein [Deltaproteobacteria bacterium]MBW2302505.1 PAS domain S-box protein [Deltaproteobacteria bacterium]